MVNWIPVSLGLPKNTITEQGDIKVSVVLCTNGMQIYKAYYIQRRECSCETYGYYDGDADIDELTGEEYFPEGWYECTANRQVADWFLATDITHWIPLPEFPEKKGDVGS